MAMSEFSVVRSEVSFNRRIAVGECPGGWRSRPTMMKPWHGCPKGWESWTKASMLVKLFTRKYELAILQVISRLATWGCLSASYSCIWVAERANPSERVFRRLGWKHSKLFRKAPEWLTGTNHSRTYFNVQSTKAKNEGAQGWRCTASWSTRNSTCLSPLANAVVPASSKRLPLPLTGWLVLSIGGLGEQKCGLIYLGAVTAIEKGLYPFAIVESSVIWSPHLVYLSIRQCNCQAGIDDSSNISRKTNGHNPGNAKRRPQLALAQNTFDLGVCHWLSSSFPRKCVY